MTKSLLEQTKEFSDNYIYVELARRTAKYHLTTIVTKTFKKGLMFKKFEIGKRYASSLIEIEEDMFK